MSGANDIAIAVEDLRVTFGKPPHAVTAVDGVSFAIRQGEIFGLVGESGCGKSVTCRSLIQLFGGARPASIEGMIAFGGRDLARLAPREFVDIRGSQIAMIFQDPMSALNPTMRIGRQIEEGLRRHEKLTARQARTRAIDLLKSVGVTAPERRLEAYPHAFSGGMRQRVLIAIALACRPKLLIADEPTTALDVTVQDQILKLILALRAETGMAVLFVTHDLGVVAQTCDRVGVMYAGRIVELAETDRLFANPAHPYTRALLNALPAHAGRSGRLQPIGGAPPNLASPPPGCRFHPRCRHAVPACESTQPPLVAIEPGHAGACLRIGELA
ncbi:ABC transporter ATP-binding protein [Labrys monachus]|uniref:Peptide/nickel transport system ATP-binding protein/oligopeptide transport system ATP-binding protein n=1 Tax=Labrys monachus TaxID=217067 RepID=A0ABU0F931_9HYPH|nr:ABC transporter ATP-binding protein [Labrys monachus]MDQ0391119.1 peptide/nickel transport system ATP-binding protein/oligopeptide transport system ATP-binding protein [Labrys monachus]